MKAEVYDPGRVTVHGGTEARIVAEACGYRWEGITDHTPEAGPVVVFGTFDDLIAVLRTRPLDTLWRPTGQPLPLPRHASWALARVDMVIAPDEVIGYATRTARARTLVIPQSVPVPVATDRSTGRHRLGGSPMRLAILLDTLDHHAAATMTLVGALADGDVRRCGSCGGSAPIRFSPVTARSDPPGRCSCGGELTSAPPIDLDASLVVVDGPPSDSMDEYLAGIRDWLGLEDVVDLQGNGFTGSPAAELELIARLASVDVVLAAGSGPSLPRGALLAAVAGVASIIPGHGAAADVPWSRRCRYRTETVANGTVRVHLDLADAAREILEVAATGAGNLCKGSCPELRAVADAHDVGHLAARWHHALGRLATAPRPLRARDVGLPRPLGSTR